jgi:hypothetical protein
MTTILDAMGDAECFGPWFQGDSWAAWRAILAGGRSPPSRRVRELWIVAGRRAGKDSIASMLATYAATIDEAHVGRLRPGEQAVVQCL